jgi:hypothetical protein
MPGGMNKLFLERVGEKARPSVDTSEDEVSLSADLRPREKGRDSNASRRGRCQNEPTVFWGDFDGTVLRLLSLCRPTRVDLRGDEVNSAFTERWLGFMDDLSPELHPFVY